jgi:MerR family transcriptional regulator, redox-sensitive transcriptional activator SoxR
VFTIGQVALKAGLRASAIRYYEEQGLLPPAPRHGGKRVYDASILVRLSAIELAKTAGFTLREIRTLVATNGERPRRTWRSMTGAKRSELDREMARLALMKTVLERLDGCRCSTLEDCGRIFETALAKYRATHA